MVRLTLSPGEIIVEKKLRYFYFPLSLSLCCISKQEQIVLERPARLNLDPGRGDYGDRGDG